MWNPSSSSSWEEENENRMLMAAEMDDAIGFEDYEVTTIDPGNTVLIGTILFCFLLIVALPCLVKCGRFCKKRRKNAQGAEDTASEASLTTDVVAPKDTTIQRMQQQTAHAMEHPDSDDDEDDSDSIQSGLTGVASHIVNVLLDATPHGGPLRRGHTAVVAAAHNEYHDADMMMMMGGDGGSVLGGISMGEVSHRDALQGPQYGKQQHYYADGLVRTDEQEPSFQPEPKHPCCSRGGLSRTWNKLLDIMEYDYETKRLLKLSGPYVTQAIAQGTLEAVRVAVIGKFIGTPALSAYVMVDIWIGLTTSVIRGVQETCGSLCSHAIGAGNRVLAGQYIQIATVLYVLAFAPLFVCWEFLMGPLLSFLGFDEVTRQIGEHFTILYLFYKFLVGVGESAHELLDVIGLEKYSTAFNFVYETIVTVGIVLVSIFSETSNLQLVGLVYVVFAALALIINVAIVVWNGWFDRYLEGMVGSFAMRANWKATKLMMKTASALSAGQLLAYGEWELLTVFASFLGPAEVAAWGLLGTLWDALELVTEAVSDAGEVRTAFLLGAGKPEKAKLSSYKSISLSVFISTFITSILFIFGDSIPVWMTNDPTLQKMIADLIPLFGIGNIALAVGTTSWTLVGSQGRFRLATAVGYAGSWFVTLPLAVLFSIVLRIDLQAQTGAVVVGYMVSGTLNTYILLQSDWPKLSRRIKAQVEEDMAEDDDDDSSSSSSSSSSSDSQKKNSETMPTGEGGANTDDAQRSIGLAIPRPPSFSTDDPLALGRLESMSQSVSDFLSDLDRTPSSSNLSSIVRATASPLPRSTLMPVPNAYGQEDIVEHPPILRTQSEPRFPGARSNVDTASLLQTNNTYDLNTYDL